MRTVQLVRLERAIEHAIGNHPEYMDALAQDDWARGDDLPDLLRVALVAVVEPRVDYFGFWPHIVNHSPSARRSLGASRQAAESYDLT
jgi:hypothetical protein